MTNVMNIWTSPVTVVITVIGLVWLAAKIFSFWRMIVSVFILPGDKLTKHAPRGSWAIVTGASDGIGKEFALQLARQGYNIFLLSRTESKLLHVVELIKTQSPDVQTAIHVLDLASANDDSWSHLSNHLSSISPSSSSTSPAFAILINNAGQSHSIPVPFSQTSKDELEAIVRINCISTLRITSCVLPHLQARKQGLILTIASFGGVIPTPLLATYSGSKAFLQHWSSALASELAPEGIKVQLVQSYLVTGKMSKIRKTSLLIPSPEEFVASALAKIGRSTGAQGVAATMVPWWSHAVMYWFLQQLGVMSWVVVEGNKMFHEKIRNRALRKMEREKKQG